MSKRYEIWTKGILFYLTTLILLGMTPKFSQASGLLDLRKDVEVLNVPYEGALLDFSNQIVFSDKYLENNMMAFPTYRKIIANKSSYYAFDSQEFFTLVSIYHIYKSYPRYYKSLLDYAVISNRMTTELAVAVGKGKEENRVLDFSREVYKKNYENEVKKGKIRSKRSRTKLIIWTIGGVVLGASLGTITGVFVEKYY
ncbi:hypothetical protein N8Z24_00525 [bacterium]|nr:hypothetical protein [bacterium]